MIEVNINITLSKILAFTILMIGSMYAFMTNDSYVLISTFGSASAIITVKTFTESRERQKKIEHPEPPQNSDGPNI